MDSRIPKVLHAVGGVPMVARVLAAIRNAGLRDILVCIPPGEDGRAIARALPVETRTVVQNQPLGTGHAVRVALDHVSRGAGTVLVVGADTPLVTSATLIDLIRARAGSAMAVAVAELTDPGQYGRVVLGPDGAIQRIVEATDAAPAELAIQLVNGLLFAFDADWLRSAIGELRTAPNGEYYLTQLVELATAQGKRVAALRVEEAWQVAGVNSRRDLAELERALRGRVASQLMAAGVTLEDPASTYVDERVVVGRDVVLRPQTFLRGNSRIGDGCIIGPGVEVIDCQLGEGVQVSWSVLEGAQIGDRVHIGPYCRVRPGTVIEEDVHLGSFAEVKNTRIGRGSQVHHFSYLGDAQLGPEVNVGAGTVTCNYDGQQKHQTVIGAGAFIGSDTMLIAPVTVGEGAMTGAGAVVTRDVPPGARVVGVPARPLITSRAKAGPSSTRRKAGRASQAEGT